MSEYLVQFTNEVEQHAFETVLRAAGYTEFEVLAAESCDDDMVDPVSAVVSSEAPAEEAAPAEDQNEDAAPVSEDETPADEEVAEEDGGLSEAEAEASEDAGEEESYEDQAIAEDPAPAEAQAA